jgi:ADP-ribosylglycohydrolase
MSTRAASWLAWSLGLMSVALLSASTVLLVLNRPTRVVESAGVAILRYRLYDIDLLINRTLVYGSLTVALALVYFGGVAAAEAIFRTLTGQEQQPQLAIVISTLVIAALFNPLRRRIQSFIDRRFYRRKYDTAKTLEAFSTKLRGETDLDALSYDLVGVVRETMQPAHVSLWLHPDPALKDKKKRAAIRESGHDE